MFVSGLRLPPFSILSPLPVSESSSLVAPDRSSLKNWLRWNRVCQLTSVDMTVLVEGRWMISVGGAVKVAIALSRPAPDDQAGAGTTIRPGFSKPLAVMSLRNSVNRSNGELEFGCPNENVLP